MDPTILHALWFECPVLSDTQHKLLLALAYHCHHGVSCHPSVPRLARMIRRSVRQTRTLLRQLEQAGYLHVQGQRGRGHANTYTLNRQRILPVFSETGSVDCRSKPEVQTAAEFKQEKERTDLPRFLKRLGLTPGSDAWHAALNGSA
jgi:MarR-like DNA-binding transcriptional regulator SgrR of sgrS sRNA